MPGLSEDNPSVQVIPTPTPLVPHFQMLLLDLLKVLQQLCVVDTGGICFLRLGDCLHTVSGERKQKGPASVSQHLWGLLGGRQHLAQEAGPQAGGTHPQGVCLPQVQHPFPSSPKELGSPMSIPSPTVGEPVNTATWIWPSACGLATEPRVGIALRSISCLRVAPFGAKARANSQPGSQLGPGRGSRDKGEEAAWPFLWGPG